MHKAHWPRDSVGRLQYNGARSRVPFGAAHSAYPFSSAQAGSSARSRYLLSGYAQQLSKSIQFPFGTLAVNLVGCALVGFIAELADQRGVLSGETRAFLIVGLLGGFTTFSAFGNETMNLLRDGELWLACGNIVGHTFLGLVAVWLGYSTAYLLWK